jgi:hypothetical protein
MKKIPITYYNPEIDDLPIGELSILDDVAEQMANIAYALGTCYVLSPTLHIENGKPSIVSLSIRMDGSTMENITKPKGGVIFENNKENNKEKENQTRSV